MDTREPHYSSQNRRNYLKLGFQNILGVTANKVNESGRAIRRRIIAKGESNPAPFFLRVTFFQNVSKVKLDVDPFPFASLLD